MFVESWFSSLVGNATPGAIVPFGISRIREAGVLSRNGGDCLRIKCAVKSFGFSALAVSVPLSVEFTLGAGTVVLVVTLVVSVLGTYNVIGSSS